MPSNRTEFIDDAHREHLRQRNLQYMRTYLKDYRQGVRRRKPDMTQDEVEARKARRAECTAAWRARKRETEDHRNDAGAI